MDSVATGSTAEISAPKRSGSIGLDVSMRANPCVRRRGEIMRKHVKNRRGNATYPFYCCTAHNPIPVLQRAIVNRTYGIHKTLLRYLVYIQPFFIF